MARRRGVVAPHVGLGPRWDSDAKAIANLGFGITHSGDVGGRPAAVRDVGIARRNVCDAAHRSVRQSRDESLSIYNDWPIVRKLRTKTPRRAMPLRFGCRRLTS